jgi:outer membrane protein assembly factor BamB
MLHPDQTSYFGGKLGTADGEVVAIDAATGKIAWDTEVTGDPTGGVTVVNDLVLTGTFQGNVVALDRTTGAVVWTHAAPAGVSGWMAVSGGSLFVPTGILGSGDHLVDLHLPGS